MTKEINSSYFAKHSSKGRFVDASLLCLLKEKKSYGYSLMEDLSKFGFTEDEVNISIIYRKLRSMEKENLVVSSWSESDQGPNKRTYEITDKGRQELDDWIDFLKDRINRINLIIKKYESSK